MTITEIDTRIKELETELLCPRPHPTEIYTRIVGYYRSLANWNAGKREEYDHRVTFEEDDRRIDLFLKIPQGQSSGSASGHSTVGSGPKAASYVVFLKEDCPNCPALKAKLPLLPFNGTVYDAAGAAGLEAAAAWEIYATPTLILLDAGGHEILRISSALEWNRLGPSL